MAIKLPKLTTDVDCEPLGYPGMVVTFWLNPSVDDYEPPEEGGEPWDTPFYHSIGRVMLSVFIPKGEDAPAQTLKLGTAKALYDLERDPGGDSQLIMWVIQQYSNARDERLQAELGN